MIVHISYSLSIAMARKPAAPLKQPVQARSKHTVEAILQAAVQVFESHGYAAGTTARVAERAGVSVGTLYQYFPNKDAVIAALASRHVEDIRAFAEGGADQRGLAKVPMPALLDGLVDEFVKMHQANPDLHRLMSRGEFVLEETRKELARIRTAAAVKLACLLKQGKEVRRGNYEIMAYFVLESLEHFTHTLVLEPPPSSLQSHVAKELKKLLKSYVLRN